MLYQIIIQMFPHVSFISYEIKSYFEGMSILNNFKACQIFLLSDYTILPYHGSVWGLLFSQIITEIYLADLWKAWSSDECCILILFFAILKSLASFYVCV